jgi:hypothetical protein
LLKKNAANKLKSAVAEFNLDGKVSTVVHDNARNMSSVGKKCPEWDDLNCFFTLSFSCLASRRKRHAALRTGVHL